MTASINTEILIHARREKVWAALMDFASYPSWNPFIVAIEGEAVEGARLKVRISLPGSGAQTVRPVVLRAEAPSAFIWRGSLPVPGLFTGEHAFQLVEEGDATRFHHSERFSGILVPVLRKMLASTEDGFNQMNAALKARVETQT